MLTLRILNNLASSTQISVDPSISSIQAHPLLHILKFSLDYLSTLQLSSHLHYDVTNATQRQRDVTRDNRNGVDGASKRSADVSERGNQTSYDDTALRIKHLLCALVFTCVRKIVTCREFAKYVIQYAGCLSTLIKIVEDVVSKIDNAKLAKSISDKLAKAIGEEISRDEAKKSPKVSSETVEKLPAVSPGSKEPSDGQVGVQIEANKTDNNVVKSGVENTDHVNSGESDTKGITGEQKNSENEGDMRRENRITNETHDVKTSDKNAGSIQSENLEVKTSNEEFSNVESTNANELDEIDAQWNTYLFNLTFTVLILYKHIIKHYSINEEKFNIFLQILNNFVNNKNINTVIKENVIDKEAGKQIIHELLLIKILRLMDNKHKIVVFNLLNELVLNIQHFKVKLINSEKGTVSERLNNAQDINAPNDNYHHVSMLGNSYSMLNNSKCIVSNLNLIVISFLNESLSRNNGAKYDRNSESSIGARKTSSQIPDHGSVVRNGCCRSKVIDQNHLNFHIIKLLLNNGACCCFPHKLLVNKIHTLLTSSESNKKIATYCFMLLENMLYTELNYYSDCAPCKYCDLVFVESNSNSLHEVSGSPSRGLDSRSNGDVKNNSSETKSKTKFTIASILSKGTKNADKSWDKKSSKITNMFSSSGNATSTSTDDRSNLTKVQDKRKTNPNQEVGAKPCSSIDEELLIGFYKSIIQRDQYKLKCKLLAHLIRIVNAFKPNLQLELVEHVIQPLFLKLKTRLMLSKYVCKEFLVLTEKFSPKQNEELNEFIIVDSDCNIITSDKLNLCTGQVEDKVDVDEKFPGKPDEVAEVVADISGTPEEKNPVDNVLLSGEGIEGQSGKKVTKRRRSKKNSESKNNVPQR